MRGRSMWIGRFLGAAALTAFAALGVWWAVDRAHRWETPRLDAALFTAVSDAALVSSRGRDTWLVPINLRCPTCMGRARELSVLGRAPHAPRLIFLVVDQRRKPSPSALAGLSAGGAWWDGRGVWRHRWGHRLYGEILRFDSRGRYRGTTPPSGAAAEVPEPPPDEGGEEG